MDDPLTILLYAWLLSTVVPDVSPLPVSCPHHTPAGDPAVTKGTAVQTVQAGGCYVLGVSLLVF